MSILVLLNLLLLPLAALMVDASVFCVRAQHQLAC